MMTNFPQQGKELKKKICMLAKSLEKIQIPNLGTYINIDNKVITKPL